LFLIIVVTLAAVEVVLVVVLSVEVDVVSVVVKLCLVEVLEVVVVFLVVVGGIVLVVFSFTSKVVVFKDVDSSSGALVVSTSSLVDVEVVVVIQFSSVVDEDVAVVVFSSEVVVVCTDVGISVANETNVSSGSSGTCSRAMSRTSLTI